MNKNRLGFAWLLLTLIMVGMSLSPMVDSNVLQVSETVDSTEIVADQNDDFEQEKSKDWSQEEQMNNEEGVQVVSDTLIPQSDMENILSRNNGEELVEEESPLDVEEELTEGRIVDQACIGDFNLDLDGDADLIDRGNGFPEELDAAPELLEDFQSADDYNAEEGIFNYADAGWGVRDVSWTSWGPESGQDREVVMSGQRLYNQYQTAYLTAGDYTLEMTDSWGDGWNGNTIYFNNQNGQTVDSATLSWGGYGEADITIPTDGFYSTDWSSGSWQGEPYWVLKAPDYPNPNAGGGFAPDALPFTLGATQGTTKALSSGTYFLTMADSWGDGWNGNSLQIIDDSGAVVLNDELDNYCTITYWWGNPQVTNCYSTTISLSIATSGDYTFVLTGGSWQNEISVTLEPDQVDVQAPSEYFMQARPTVTGDGAAMTTTCINANDYNQIFVSFGFHMYGTSSQNSGLRLDVRASDDRDGVAGADFFNGQWTTVWAQYGAGSNYNNQVDPLGAFNGDWWFTENMELTGDWCNDEGCASELSFRFFFDNGYSSRDDYAVDNFRVQGYGQFNDRDNDGIADGADDCDGYDNLAGTVDPNEFEHSAFTDITVGTNGCPPDLDGDLVYDIVDWCPSTPSTYIGAVDNNGCEPGIAMQSSTILYDGSAQEALAYVESFNTGQANPMSETIDDRDGWNAIEDDGLYNWQSYSTFSAGKFEGDRSIVHAENNNDYTDEAWMISPKVHIPADSEFGNRMSFAIMLEWFSWSGTYGYTDVNTQEFSIYASTKSCQPGIGDPGTGNMIDLMDDVTGDGVGDPIYTVPHNTLAYQTWAEQMFEIPDRFYGQDVCFAFKNAAPRSGSMFLDLFQFYQQPTPPDADNDGVWDAFPESKTEDGTTFVYAPSEGQAIDVCPDTPRGQAVIGMTLTTVNGQEGKPDPNSQPWDVGCSAPIDLPYNEAFSSLNMPAALQFGSSDGDGIQTDNEEESWEVLWNFFGSCGLDCRGIVRADDFPRVRYETKYMVMPMIEVGTQYDGVFMNWWDSVSQAWQWWDAVSYHGIQVAVVDETNAERSCEVGADTDGDLMADEVLDANGNVVNSGYEELANLGNPGTSAWTEQQVDLSSYVGKWICVAFAFRSDYDQEWWVDTISMEGVILPPDIQPPTVSEFNPYTGVDTYRADGRVVEITLADGQSGIDNGQAPTTSTMPPTIDWTMSDGTSGSVAMTETEACDMNILPYIDRECSFAGTLPEITSPGTTMTYTVTFQDVGFKTDNALVHPVTGQSTSCMSYDQFMALADSFDPPVPAEFMPDGTSAEVCGGPNQVTLGPYSYTLLDPASAHHEASMMNIGISSIENSEEEVYDVHVTYFSDVNEYVVEYEGACTGDGAIRTNNWLDDDDLVSLGAQVDNMDSTSPCGTNVIYHYSDVTNEWMVATLSSTGIDYNHNGLEAAQRDWADTVSFATDAPNDYRLFDVPSALTDVNDITNGKFGAHSFAEPSADYNVLSATSADYGDYLTTADGMSLYIFWGDDEGNNPTQACDATCQESWPAFYAGENPAVAPPLDDDDFGSFTNSLGEEQTTFQGWPLYTYVGDSFPTDANGVGAADWYLAGAGYETGPTDECVGSLTGGAPFSWSGVLCSGTYTLDMADSWGDGWNGNEFVVTDSSGAQLWSATCCGANGGFGSGTSGTATWTLDNNAQVSISVTGGSWQSEVSWDFFTAGSVFSIEGSSTQAVTADVPAGWYSLSMSDSWGDGWNGNTWTLKDGATTVAGPFTLASGSSGSEIFELTSECNGCVAQTANTGSFVWETSWTMSSTIAPVDIFADAEDFPGRMEASSPNGVGDFGVFNFPAGTYTVVMTDTWGDGWNGNGMSLVGSDGSIVANVGLASGSYGVAEFTLDDAGTYALDVGVTDTGSWDGEVGWSLSLNGFVPAGQHFTQLCVTTNGVIAFTDGDDCSASSQISNLFGFNGIMYQTSDTGFAAGASVYLQVQNILPQEVLDFGPDNFITVGDGTELSAWAHTVIEDTSDNDASLSMNLERMHPTNPGLYYEVVSAAEEAANSGCDYSLFFNSVTSGDQDVAFSLVPDATTNAPDDEVDYLQENGIHQSTEGSCALTVQLKEAGYVHDQTALTMTVANIAEERPDYAFGTEWDYELVDAVLPGTLVPLTVQVTNNDDGIASQNGAMYDHGHSIDVCFSTNDYDDCYYTAWIVDPPAPGETVSVEGQFVLDSGTELVTTSLEVHTCDTQTAPGDMNNQDSCTLDAQSAASLNGLTRKGAKVTPYNYDDTHSETLEQSNGPQSETNNDMSETNERPLRISYGVANSVPSFAPSLMAIGLVGLFAAALVQGSRSREEDDEEELIDDERAVSPVIATILMVAITVVLSGVIYVWASQLATTSTKVTPLLTFKTEASDEGFWQITVTTAENPLALQAVFVQVEFLDDSCEAGYCIITQTIAEPQTYGFTPQNSDSFVTYMDMYDCSSGEGTDGCTAEFSAMDVLRIDFDHPEYGMIEEGIVQLAYQAGGDTNVLGEWTVNSNTPSIK